MFIAAGDRGGRLKRNSRKASLLTEPAVTTAIARESRRRIDVHASCAEGLDHVPQGSGCRRSRRVCRSRDTAESAVPHQAPEGRSWRHQYCMSKTLPSHGFQKTLLPFGNTKIEALLLPAPNVDPNVQAVTRPGIETPCRGGSRIELRPRGVRARQNRASGSNTLATGPNRSCHP